MGDLLSILIDGLDFLTDRSLYKPKKSGLLTAFEWEDINS